MIVLFYKWEESNEKCHDVDQKGYRAEILIIRTSEDFLLKPAILLIESLDLSMLYGSLVLTT